MLVNGTPHRTIWASPQEPAAVCIIDQRLLPHRWEVLTLRTWLEMRNAIADMAVRGAPLIGAAAAWGMALAAHTCRKWPRELALEFLAEAAAALEAARPTAVNLRWALRRQLQCAATCAIDADLYGAMRALAMEICEDDVRACAAIGECGLELLRKRHQLHPERPLRILTHCNAGWLACVDWGTATSPLYHAQRAGIPLEVWVDETRPRNQGAKLTAWELGHQGIAHTLIADNAGGHLMQRGLVDAVIVGADRITARGDVANKIGTYLKALAAHAHGIPFWVAAPLSTLDWEMREGRDIPIEERAASEVRMMDGLDSTGKVVEVCICPADTAAFNPGFDVTPAELVSAWITERGVATTQEELAHWQSQEGTHG